MQKKRQSNNQYLYDPDRAEYITLAEASKLCAYSQEYLSLRARQGKLGAVKKGRNWVTTKEWLWEYIDSTAHDYKKQETIENNLDKRFFSQKVDWSIQTYYKLKNNLAEFATRPLKEIVYSILAYRSKTRIKLNALKNKLYKQLTELSERLIGYANVLFWILPKKFATATARQYTQWISFVLLITVSFWSVGFNPAVAAQLKTDLTETYNFLQENLLKGDSAIALAISKSLTQAEKQTKKQIAKTFLFYGKLAQDINNYQKTNFVKANNFWSDTLSGKNKLSRLNNQFYEEVSTFTRGKVLGVEEVSVGNKELNYGNLQRLQKTFAKPYLGESNLQTKQLAKN